MDVSYRAEGNAKCIAYTFVKIFDGGFRGTLEWLCNSNCVEALQRLPPQRLPVLVVAMGVLETVKVVGEALCLCLVPNVLSPLSFGCSMLILASQQASQLLVLFLCLQVSRRRPPCPSAPLRSSCSPASSLALIPSSLSRFPCPPPPRRVASLRCRIRSTAGKTEPERRSFFEAARGDGQSRQQKFGVEFILRSRMTDSFCHLLFEQSRAERSPFRTSPCSTPLESGRSA